MKREEYGLKQCIDVSGWQGVNCSSFIFVSLAQAIVICEEVQLRKCVHQMTKGDNYGTFSCLMTNVGGLTPLCVVPSLPVQVVLSCIGKQSKQVMRNNKNPS